MFTADILFPMIRKPMAQGQFYPNKKEKIETLISELIPKQTNKCSARGIIVPHAGYPFSGKVAVATIAKIAAPENIIMLGPNHTGLGKKFALYPGRIWKTPSGLVPVNQELSKKILDSGELIEIDSLAHKHEHSLEVELPILQYFFKNFTIIPICCGLAASKTYLEVATQISKALKNNLRDTLILVSTDLTHYETDDSARRKDRRAIEAIIELDPDKLLNEANKNKISICGLAPLAIALHCLKEKTKKSEVVLYQTSADATGDYASVVGYLGMIFK